MEMDGKYTCYHLVECMTAEWEWVSISWRRRMEQNILRDDWVGREVSVEILGDWRLREDVKTYEMIEIDEIV